MPVSKNNIQFKFEPNTLTEIRFALTITFFFLEFNYASLFKKKIK